MDDRNGALGWMRVAVGALVVTTCASCTTGSTASRYAPALARVAAVPTPPGTLRGDFEWAAASAGLSEAATRWERFLRDHEPRDGEYEDAYQKYRVDAARLELMRVYYLLGRRDDGDRLLRALDPLGLGKSAP
jgi:hypothetical protein